MVRIDESKKSRSAFHTMVRTACGANRWTTLDLTWIEKSTKLRYRSGRFNNTKYLLIWTAYVRNRKMLRSMNDELCYFYPSLFSRAILKCWNTLVDGCQRPEFFLLSGGDYTSGWTKNLYQTYLVSVTWTKAKYEKRTTAQHFKSWSANMSKKNWCG